MVQPERPAIHINLDDEVQCDALIEIENYIAANRSYLTPGDIRTLREFVHRVRGDAQHERERREWQSEFKDPQDW